MSSPTFRFLEQWCDRYVLRSGREGQEMAVITRRYTVEDLLALPDDGHFYELLHGEPFEVSAPDPDHGAVVAELFDWLRRAQRAGYGRARTAPLAVILDAGLTRQNAPQPDLFFIREERIAMISAEEIAGVPDLVIEVLSESTRLRDLPSDQPNRGQKWKVYEQFAVPQYWIVDPETRSLAQYTWEDGRYRQPVVLLADDRLGSSLFPRIELPVRQVFAEVLRPERPLQGLGAFRIPGRLQAISDGGAGGALER